MRRTDVVVLGAGFRGLWLSSELVKLGWDVSWVQLHRPRPSVAQEKNKGPFKVDDWPWQVGPKRLQSPLIQAAHDFIHDVLRPSEQELAVQILTKDGPLELSGPACSLGLKNFFKKSYKDIEAYLECIHQSHNLPHEAATKLLFAHTKKIFRRPLGERWVLEWLGSLRRSRPVSTEDWILQWDGDILDPENKLWLLNDSFETIVDRGMKWAANQGVHVVGDAKVADFGIEGRTITGIEIADSDQGAIGFLETKYVIGACSHETAAKQIPSFVSHVPAPTAPESEKWCWARCGFLLREGAKPAGLSSFSSYVIDPHMPLVEENMGLVRWMNGDYVTVWTCVPFDELKRRGYLAALTEKIQKNMEQFFPHWFSEYLTAVIPFEEYFQSPHLGHDDLALVFDAKTKFPAFKSKVTNLWMAGPAYDRGLELLSKLATEYRVLNQLMEIRKKELKKSDRTIQPARNGQNLVHTK